MKDWSLLIAHGVRKEQPRFVLEWRLLTMSPAMRQWFGNFLLLILNTHARPLNEALYGFVPGQQIMDVTEVVRMMLSKAREWVSGPLQLTHALDETHRVMY